MFKRGELIWAHFYRVLAKASRSNTSPLRDWTSARFVDATNSSSCQSASNELKDDIKIRFKKDQFQILEYTPVLSFYVLLGPVTSFNGGNFFKNARKV